MALKWLFIIFLLNIAMGNVSGARRYVKNIKYMPKYTEKDEKKYSTADVDKIKLTVDDAITYCDCRLMGFGIVQKIPYCKQRSDPMDVTFSSACVRCGLCLVIANKVRLDQSFIHGNFHQYINVIVHKSCATAMIHYSRGDFVI